MGKLKEKYLASKLGKSKHRKKIIVAIIVGILLVLIIVSNIVKGATPIPVEASKPVIGDLEQTVSLSGAIMSGSSTTYYAEFDAMVGDVVGLGSLVNEGDVILSYDEKSLAEAKQMAILQETIDNGNYADEVAKDSLKISETSIANMNLPQVQAQVAIYEELEISQTHALEDKRAEVQTTLAARVKQLAEGDIDCDPNEAKNQLNYDEATWQFDHNIVKMSRELEETQRTLSALKKRESELLSDSESGKYSALTKEGVEARDAKHELTATANAKRIASIEASEGGVKAPFTGVVTDMQIKGGQNVAAGTAMFVLSSMDDLYVEVNLSKYDIDKVKVGQKADLTLSGASYEGEVTEVNNVATLNDNNMPVVKGRIKVLNPDSNIVLGIEGKALIHGNCQVGTIMVPMLSVNVDTTGDFVYVIEDGVIARRNVVVGISSDEYTEIVEGLSADDYVVTDMSAGVIEGMRATPMMAEATEQTQEQ